MTIQRKMRSIGARFFRMFGSCPSYSPDHLECSVEREALPHSFARMDDDKLHIPDPGIVARNQVINDIAVLMDVSNRVLSIKITRNAAAIQYARDQARVDLQLAIRSLEILSSAVTFAGSNTKEPS